MKPSDVSHLNPDGMKLAFPYFEKILTEYYEDFLTPDVPEDPENPENPEDPEDKPSGDSNFNVEEDKDTGWSPLIPF